MYFKRPIIKYNFAPLQHSVLHKNLVLCTIELFSIGCNWNYLKASKGGPTLFKNVIQKIPL